MESYRRAELLPPGDKVPQLEAVLAGVKEQALICAHSHIPWVQSGGGRLVVNTGAVSSPNNGDVAAQYALLEWREGGWVAALRSVPYDLEMARAAFLDSGFLAAGGVMAGAFLLGIFTAQNVPGRFARHVRRLELEAGSQPGNAVPDGVWQRAIATFEWGGYARHAFLLIE